MFLSDVYFRENKSHCKEDSLSYDEFFVIFTCLANNHVLYVQDENGVNRPVCSYIRPLRAGRLLDTPRQAARFVSVLGYERAPVIGGGGGKQEQWCTLLAFLCRNQVCENSHCVTQQSWYCILTEVSNLKEAANTWIKSYLENSVTII